MFVECAALELCLACAPADNPAPGADIAALVKRLGDTSLAQRDSAEK